MEPHKSRHITSGFNKTEVMCASTQILIKKGKKLYESFFVEGKAVELKR